MFVFVWIFLRRNFHVWTSLDFRKTKYSNKDAIFNYLNLILWKNVRKELLWSESTFNMRTNIAIGNHWRVDITKENESDSILDDHIHLWLKSKKYHQNYICLNKIEVI